jgi:hypothetical protein
MSADPKLQKQIEKALGELLAGSTKTKEEKDEIRQNIGLAIKWQGVLMKQDKRDWGKAFRNGETEIEDEEGDESDGDD